MKKKTAQPMPNERFYVYKVKLFGRKIKRTLKCKKNQVNGCAKCALKSHMNVFNLLLRKDKKAYMFWFGCFYVLSDIQGRHIVNMRTNQYFTKFKELYLSMEVD